MSILEKNEESWGFFMTQINKARRRLLTTSGSVLGLASVSAISGLTPAAKVLAATQTDAGSGPS